MQAIIVAGNAFADAAALHAALQEGRAGGGDAVASSGRKAKRQAPWQHALIAPMFRLLPLAGRCRRLSWFW